MKCKLCDSSELKKFKVKNKSWEKNYYYCNTCNLIFLDTELLLNKEEELKRYKMHNNHLEDPVYRNYFKKFIEYSFSEIKEKKIILDFGSGPEPVLADVLKEQGHKVYIYDKYFKVDESVFDRKYEIITSTEVFEHIEYPLSMLKKLIYLLKKDGILILMTCFHKNDINRFSKWWYIQDPTHITFFSKETFEYIAKTLNLKIIKQNNKNIVVFKRR